MRTRILQSAARIDEVIMLSWILDKVKVEFVRQLVPTMEKSWGNIEWNVGDVSDDEMYHYGVVASLVFLSD